MCPGVSLDFQPSVSQVGRRGQLKLMHTQQKNHPAQPRPSRPSPYTTENDTSLCLKLAPEGKWQLLASCRWGLELAWTHFCHIHSVGLGKSAPEGCRG